MAKIKKNCNQQTILATENLLNVEIVFISSLGLGESHEITSSTWSPLARRFIDHFAKNCRIHDCKLTSVC